MIGFVDAIFSPVSRNAECSKSGWDKQKLFVVISGNEFLAPCPSLYLSLNTAFKSVLHVTLYFPSLPIRFKC